MRIAHTRIFCTGLLVLLFFTQSRWQREHHWVVPLMDLCSLALIAIAVSGRLWCSLYISGYKRRALVQQGPYSMCRHPLYFFSLLGAAGIAMKTDTLSVPLFIVAVFAAYYPWVIRREEFALERRFGSAFESYRQTVPAFWPRPWKVSEPQSYNAMPHVFRRERGNVLGFIIAPAVIDALPWLRELCGLRALWCLP